MSEVNFDDIEEMDIEEQFDHLEQVREATEPPKRKPKKLPPDKIKTIPEVFQPRDTERGEMDIEDHISELAGPVKSGRDLEAVTVYKLGSHWVCINGHCRLEAYSRNGNGRDIPVTVFDGNVSQAWHYSGEGNSKDHLPLSRDDKSDRAWEAVCLGSRFTIEEIVTMSGRGKSHVSTARQVRAKLIAEGENPLDYDSWNEARQRAKGKKEIDMSEVNKQKAKKGAQALQKIMGPKAGQYPDVIVQTLRTMKGKTGKRVMEYIDSEYIRPAIMEEIQEAGGPELWYNTKMLQYIDEAPDHDEF